MGRYAILVVGPAGSGKTTFCACLQEHALTVASPKRTVHVVNLDPAVLNVPYNASYDVRDLLTVEDTQRSEGLGPNGALVALMEGLLEEEDWLQHNFSGQYDDDFLIFDLPGQIELLSQIPIVPQLAHRLSRLGSYHVVVCFLLDAQSVVIDRNKYVSGCLCALSAMVALDTPFLTFLSKTDLLQGQEKDNLERFLNCDFIDSSVNFALDSDGRAQSKMVKSESLRNALCSLIEDFNLVNFIPWSVHDEEGIMNTFSTLDYVLQYGEDEDLPNPPEDKE